MAVVDPGVSRVRSRDEYQEGLEDEQDGADAAEDAVNVDESVMEVDGSTSVHDDTRATTGRTNEAGYAEVLQLLRDGKKLAILLDQRTARLSAHDRSAS